MDDLVTLDVSDGVGRLTLNLPAKANALTADLLQELEVKLAEIETDRTIQMVVLSGSGDRFFCAGGAFNDWGKLHARDMGRQYIRTTNRIIDRIELLDAFTVSWVNGAAIGGGLELALATDLRVAHPDAQFSVPELSIGAVPGMRGIERLSALVGIGRAKDMVLAGRKLDAGTALEWGLVSEVATDVEAAMASLKARIAKQSGDALATAKQMFRALTGGPAAAHAVHEIAGTASKYSADGQEGVRALMEKRTPIFTSARGEDNEDDI